jgi:hypothetical protein
MTSNILASISEMLTPEIIGKLATASGMDRTIAREAVNATVPAILNSIADLVMKPGGARKLISAVDEQSGDLESLSNQLVGPSQAASSGINLLSSLLGSRTPNIIASGVANLFGVSTNAVQTILGLVTPFVLSGLQRIQHARGLDAAGLAQMLGEQKDTFATAMPDGLATYLRKSGLVDEATRPRPATRPAAAPSMPAMASQTRPDGGAKGVAWPYWVLALAALGALLWALMPHDDIEGTQTASITNNALEQPRLLPPTNGKIVYFARPERTWVSIGTAPNDYVDRVVHNVRGEPLGTVRDVLMGPDGKATAAVISVGRYLGIGDKIVAVPFTALRTEQREGDRRIVIDIVREALQSAPQFENIPASTK